MTQVRCNKCKYVGEESEFPKGLDFFQKTYIASCPKCDNVQNPGDASMRMFGGERPFEYVREALPEDASAVEEVFHNADEAS